MSDSRKHTTEAQHHAKPAALSMQRMGRLSDLMGSKTFEHLDPLTPEERRSVQEALAVGKTLSKLPEGLWRKVQGYLDGPPKRRGRPKGKRQAETLERIGDAAALVFLNYSQSKMIPLLYPKQHVPEAGRKAVNKLLRRHKDAIAYELKVMTRERAERIAKSLPRDKK